MRRKFLQPARLIPAATFRTLRLRQRAVVSDQLLHHIGAQFFFEAVHVLAFALGDDIDHFGFRKFLHFGRAHVLHFQFSALGGVASAVLSVAHRTFIEINVLRGGRRRRGRSARRSSGSGYQNERKTRAGHQHRYTEHSHDSIHRFLPTNNLSSETIIERTKMLRNSWSTEWSANSR